MGFSAAAAAAAAAKQGEGQANQAALRGIYKYTNTPAPKHSCIAAMQRWAPVMPLNRQAIAIRVLQRRGSIPLNQSQLQVGAGAAPSLGLLVS